jgi:hypothetical protein
MNIFFDFTLIKSDNLILTNIKNEVNNNINLFCQFFINKNLDRHNEILFVLKKNVENKFINKIYLLNEKIYTNDELGISSDKIIQININKRLKFNDVFLFINENNITGYNVIANSDIFFDDSIEKLQYSDLHLSKKICSLLRYEFNIDNSDNSKLLYHYFFGSQDTWIIHSNNILDKDQISKFDFEFGKPNCDGKFSYLFYTFNYKIINDPKTIKTFHYHKSNFKTYTKNDLIIGHTLGIIPCKLNFNDWMQILYVHIANISIYILIVLLFLLYIFYQFSLKL